MALIAENIKYLAFEGGGGKGASYLGAIHALEQLKIITHDASGKLNVDRYGTNTKSVEIPNGGITGISGASAGAITALLIGCGYKSAKIKQIFLTTNFNDFFDDPFYIRNKADIPLPGNRFNFCPDDWKDLGLFKSESAGTSWFFDESVLNLSPGNEPNWNAWENNLNIIFNFLNPLKKDDFLNLFYRLLREFTPDPEKSGKYILNTILSFIMRSPLLSLSSLTPWNTLDLLINWITNQIKKDKDLKQETKDKLQKYFELYLNSLFLDFGFFSGTKVHQVLDQWITEKYDPGSTYQSTFANQKRNDPNKNDPLLKIKNLWITFEEFREVFKVDLKFTATNISSGAVEILSADTTPKLSVATAARMSMGIPAVFKPIIINDDEIKYLNLGGSENIVETDTNDLNGKPILINKWKGYWVDGGFFDNAPIRVWGTNMDKAVLLRLGPRYIKNDLEKDRFNSYIVALGKCVGNLGSGQVTSTNYALYDHIIQLKTGFTNTLQFDYTLPPLPSVGGGPTFDVRILKIWNKNFYKVAEAFYNFSLQPDTSILPPTSP
ncbi:MAG: patatin-like phospholipase family protein [Bacteroidetes bacterium]|nr:patatin-like phospholipase family protein [Bacteroidota bacterium]